MSCNRDRFSLPHLLLASGLGIALPGSACAQEGQGVPDGAVLSEVRAFVASELEAQHIPGLSISLVMADQLVWSQGFGFANIETGLRATGSTIYRIGSVSKPIVGTALMLLAEQGEVDIDAELQVYVPEFPIKRWPIHIRHLLTHTSGIRHYRGDEFLSMEHYTNLADPLEIFKDDPLLFEPGKRYSYSTYGFNLIANVVEAASGVLIADYMREKIFHPAWMNDTGLEDHLTIIKGRAHWYQSDAAGNWQNAPYADLSNKYAGGGITSTVEDLARLHIAYARGVLLQAATIERMYEPQRLADGKRHGYALSWRVARVKLPDGREVRQVSHSGGSVGASTLFLRYPDQGLAIAIIANHSAKLARITSGVLQRVLQR